MPVDHYENFPVASILLPRRLVPAVEAIYAFARSADDIADEGDALPEQRLAALSSYEAALDGIERGEPPPDPMFARLAAAIARHRLPLRPFRDLLSAFKQDIVTNRYQTLEDVLDYCGRSANPVGYLMLSLYGAAEARSVRESNAICSALQLINFLQDVAVDRAKDRIYLPLGDLDTFGIDPAQLDRQVVDDNWRALMSFEVARTRKMMAHGAPLAKRLHGRIGLELRMVVQGGLRILDKIEAVGYDVFTRRPTLGPLDWVVVAWRALKM